MVYTYIYICISDLLNIKTKDIYKRLFIRSIKSLQVQSWSQWRHIPTKSTRRFLITVHILTVLLFGHLCAQCVSLRLLSHLVKAFLSGSSPASTQRCRAAEKCPQATAISAQKYKQRAGSHWGTPRHVVDNTNYSYNVCRDKGSNMDYYTPNYINLIWSHDTREHRVLCVLVRTRSVKKLKYSCKTLVSAVSELLSVVCLSVCLCAVGSAPAYFWFVLV